jgi:hypothetical protein
MLRRIGTCRKKVMGMLRLMGNKADVVKGLAKRCNEHWRIAPTSDIVSFVSCFPFWFVEYVVRAYICLISKSVF